MNKQQKLEFNAKVREIQSKAMELAQDYGDVKNERIISPGKFEGEHYAIVYFYEQSMDGTCEQRGNCDIIELTKEERKAFNTRNHNARLYHSDQGFVRLDI